MATYLAPAAVLVAAAAVLQAPAPKLVEVSLAASEEPSSMPAPKAIPWPPRPASPARTAPGGR